MSEEQISALLAKLKDDAGLQEKLKGAADLDAALAIAKDAGFDVSKADWLRYQANQTLELSDEELEGVSGGILEHWPTYKCFGRPREVVSYAHCTGARGPAYVCGTNSRVAC
jgi:predicted ribosomally synthesized peptide with nif11-like leader